MLWFYMLLGAVDLYYFVSNFTYFRKQSKEYYIIRCIIFNNHIGIYNTNNLELQQQSVKAKMDDIMLNIVTNKGKQALQQKNTESLIQKSKTKTDVKRQKYTKKLKMRNSISKSQRKNKDKTQGQEGETVNVQRKKNIDRSKKIKQERNQGMFGSLVTGLTKKRDYEILNHQLKKKQSKIKKEVKQQNSNVKYEQNQQNQRRTSQKKSYSLSHQKKSFHYQPKTPRLKPSFTPQSRKDVTIPELMPEKAAQENFIDRNQLSNFNLQQKLQDSLIRSGVSKLTEIQMKSYETLVNGVDCIIKASTGSGKTLAYLIPLVNRLLKNQVVTKREDGTCVIVVCPTRELCVQGQKQANRCLKRCPYIISGCLFGGQQTNHQKSRLRKGTNILFCTPGRVLYHLQQTQSFKLNNLQAIVFQEADRTLDMGFQESVHKIIKILSQKATMTHTHKILVSAHFNSKVSSLIQQLQMTEPSFIGFQNIDAQMNLQNLKQSKDVQINTSAQLKHQYVLMSQQQKIPLMMAYLGVLKKCKVLIFVSTIDEVQFFDYLLTNLKFRDSNGIDTETRFQSRPVYKIHGDLDQKLRSKTYLQFRQSKEAILISTQVASRGLDFPDLSHIILYDVPPTITDYGNRVGRSARFNQTGVSLLMLHYIQSDYAEKIRYYVPNLQLIEKDIIYESYQKVLKSMNIGDSSLHYIEGLIRSSVKNDNEKYTIARKAYVSMLRAYARMPDRNIFAVKKLNLKLLARSFGLNNAQADKSYNPKAKNSFLETNRKKRKVEDVKKLQSYQYL